MLLIQTRVGLWLTTKNPFATLSQTACGAVVTSQICDADAMRVDQVIAQLKKHNQEWHKVLVLAFVRDMGDRQITARLGITKYAAGEVV